MFLGSDRANVYLLAATKKQREERLYSARADIKEIGLRQVFEMTVESREPPETAGPAGSHTDQAGPAGHAPCGKLYMLTPRELKVLELVLEGLTNPQIGQRLGISPRTVSSHLTTVFRKLRVHSRIRLILQAPELKPEVEKLQRAIDAEEAP